MTPQGSQGWKPLSPTISAPLAPRRPHLQTGQPPARAEPGLSERKPYWGAGGAESDLAARPGELRPPTSQLMLCSRTVAAVPTSPSAPVPDSIFETLKATRFFCVLYTLRVLSKTESLSDFFQQRSCVSHRNNLLPKSKVTSTIFGPHSHLPVTFPRN